MSHPKSLGAAGPWVPGTLCAISRAWTPGVLDMAPPWFPRWPGAPRGWTPRGLSTHGRVGERETGQGGACSGGQACPAGAVVRRSCVFKRKSQNVIRGRKCFLLVDVKVLLPGKSHGWRSLVGSSPWGH